MLIVAAPKTASTSLLKTLEKLHGLPGRQLFFSDRPQPADYALLPEYHGDVRRISPDLARRFDAPDVFYKQHLPPTPHNLELLRDVPKVVLLRDPEAIVDAYHRGVHSGAHAPLAEVEDEDSVDDWRERAESLGLVADLEAFVEGWENAGGKQLVVGYRELVEDPTRVVRRIERYFGLSETRGPVELKKERYSRRNRLEALLVQRVIEPALKRAYRIKRKLLGP